MGFLTIAEFSQMSRKYFMKMTPVDFPFSPRHGPGQPGAVRIAKPGGLR